MTVTLDISGNTITIRDESSVLYTVSAGKIVVHPSKIPTFLDSSGKDLSESLRKKSCCELVTCTLTLTPGGFEDRCVEVFLKTDSVSLQEGGRELFSINADCIETKMAESPKLDLQIPTELEVCEYLHKKPGNYQYVQGVFGDITRIDLDSGDRVNITALEKKIARLKSGVPAGGCGCCLMIGIGIGLIFALV